ncbi:hypothetical protein [Stenotrophomonas chelatiphaga]|uniref:hypothetical protein n=1 Tax=Stenotrophomonas chelatiphaga TaxID=517011 RepID=UPI001FDEB1A8|nr:hypothetical protein [Stenotrophomonas chelatiphaga]
MLRNILLLFVVAAMAPSSVGSAQASEPIAPVGVGGTVGSISDDALMQQWSLAQDACRGNPEDETACAKRNRATAGLIARGYEQHNHDVWTSPSDAGHFDGVVQSSDDWAVNQSSLVMLMAGPAALKTLRNHLSDEKIIALWNESSDSMRHEFPRAWSILSPQMRKIEIDHKGESDVRYSLD